MSTDVAHASTFLGPTQQPQPPAPNSVPSPTYDDSQDLSTIPDPRSRNMSPASGHGFPSPAGLHPDLDEEVATLSTKLISAINHQTTLDDTLSAVRLELEEARATIRRLEERLAEQREMLSGDVWVRRKTVEAEKNKLLSRVAEEKKGRLEVEGQKKKIELELENLTAALFEEANKMVITAKEEARREQEVLQRKNDLLKTQLADTEGLLKSQHDQLAELKIVMEQMSLDRDDQTAITAPSSPGFSKFDSKGDDVPLSAADSSIEPVSPSYPTSFTHLVQPILRTDLAAFEDFVALVKTTKRLSVKSRPASGTFSGTAMSALGLGLGHSMTPSNASTTSISSGTAPASSSGSLPPTPNTPGSLSAGSGAAAVPIPPLKDSKFYKRALAEDIEPTLRLDIAPGLSWLARRAVVSAMTDGSLMVEPVPPATPGSLAAITKPQFFPCSLCGENRKEAEHLRTHRFRTSDSESAQRYPLCRSYCLLRVRAACDFLGFLRLLKDGHWRNDDDDAVKAAWEESVRLREQMFWARIGGGVIPATPAPSFVRSPALADRSSPRPVEADATRPSVEISSEESDKTVTPVAVESPQEKQEPAAAAAAKVDGLGLDVAAPPTSDAPSDAPPAAVDNDAKQRPMTPPGVQTEAEAEMSSQEKEETSRPLSLQIPGQFHP